MQIITVDASSVTPAAFQVDQDAIRKTAEEYAGIVIGGLGDKAGRKAANEGRVALKAVRTAIERRRKELKEGSLAFGKAVDTVAKSLTSLVEPTERLLEERIAAIEREEERIRQDRLQDRVEALGAVGVVLPSLQVEGMTEEDFVSLLTEYTKQFKAAEAERARVAAEVEQKRREEDESRKVEQERIRVESEKLRAEQEEFARQQEIIKADQARKAEAIRIEQERLEAERRKIEQEKAEAIRIEQERLEAENERLALARIEEARPDIDKIMTFADKVRNLVPPKLSRHSSTSTSEAILDALHLAALNIVDIANNLKCRAGRGEA